MADAAELVRAAAVHLESDGRAHIGNVAGRVVLHLGERDARDLLEGRGLCCGSRGELERACELAYPEPAQPGSASD